MGISRPFRTLLMAGTQNTPNPTAVVHKKNAASRLKVVDITLRSLGAIAAPSRDMSFLKCRHGHSSAGSQV